MHTELDPAAIIYKMHGQANPVPARCRWNMSTVYKNVLVAIAAGMLPAAALTQQASMEAGRAVAAFNQLKARAQPFDGQSLALLRLRAGPPPADMLDQLAREAVSAEINMAMEIGNWRDAEEYQKLRGKAANQVAVVEWSQYRTRPHDASRFARYLLLLDDWNTAFPNAPGKQRAALILDPLQIKDRPDDFTAHYAEPIIAQLLKHFIELGTPERLYLTAAIPELKYDFDKQAFINGSNRAEERGDFLPRPRLKYPVFLKPGADLDSYLETALPPRAQGYSLYGAEPESEYVRNPSAAVPHGRELAWRPSLGNAVRLPSALAIDRNVSMSSIPVEPGVAETQLKATVPGTLQGEGWRMVVELSSPKAEVLQHTTQHAPTESSTIVARLERVLILGPGGEVVLDLPAAKFPPAGKAGAINE